MCAIYNTTWKTGDNCKIMNDVKETHNTDCRIGEEVDTTCKIGDIAHSRPK